MSEFKIEAQAAQDRHNRGIAAAEIFRPQRVPAVGDVAVNCSGQCLAVVVFAAVFDVIAASLPKAVAFQERLAT